MPLEIVIDAKKKYAATAPRTLVKLDSLQAYVKTFPDIGRALAITEGIKFAVQAGMGGDSSSYAMPVDASALSFVGTMLREQADKTPEERRADEFAALLTSFVDSTGQKTRLSLAMADVGSVRLPKMLDSMKRYTATLFDTARYDVSYTGTSIVFLEGNKFIISSLRDSLLLAFAMILVCMVALFRSIKVVLIALTVNIVPLLMTAGIMGLAGVTLKPSTVLVFSVALGIAVDVTIRFLVAFRQEQREHPTESLSEIIRRTIYDTGQSIIYTSLVLTAGFAVFCLSQFDGTKSLGYLTSITLLLAMITNLALQPAMLLSLLGKKEDKDRLKAGK
jgi:predicted RND superfamily exporter protein